MIDGARVMMWLNYRRGPSLAVPAPFDDESSPVWWYDRIAEMAHSLAGNGVKDVLFPNPIKGESGAYRTGDGYNPVDDYDAGGKNQQGRRPTRFGDIDQLRRAIAICRANGISVHIDHVMHQRMGRANGVYRYVGADGKTLNGRFPKDPGCFRGAPPRVPQDPVPSPKDDFSFGDELCPVNSIPKGYVWNELIKAGDWLFRTLGVQGARLDDTKGMNIGFIKAFMTSGAMKDKFFFGEYASGNRNDTNWWVDQVNGRASSIDFDWHYNMAQPMCNNAGDGTFYMGSMANRGMIGNNPMKAIPFVESMDSDTNGFAGIVHNKALAYALMLGGEGLPMVYIRDYLREPDCYGLKGPIDNLMWCHQNLASGPTVPRHGDAKVYVFERTGQPGLLVTLNNDVWDPAWKTVTVQTNFGSNVQIHDYTGHNGTDYWTDNNGRVTIGIPPGADGMGYGMWSRTRLGRPIPIKRYTCTQTFFCADDLDIPKISPGANKIGRVWAEKGSLMFVYWSPRLDVGISVLGPDGTQLPSISSLPATGWYTLVVNAAPTVSTPETFALTVEYQAPQTITREQF